MSPWAQRGLQSLCPRLDLSWVGAEPLTSTSPFFQSATRLLGPEEAAEALGRITESRSPEGGRGQLFSILGKGMGTGERGAVGCGRREASGLLWGAAEGGAGRPPWGRGCRYNLCSPTAGSPGTKLWGGKVCLRVNSSRQEVSYPPMDRLPQVDGEQPVTRSMQAERDAV